jgi:hypothetical protein
MPHTAKIAYGLKNFYREVEKVKKVISPARRSLQTTPHYKQGPCLAKKEFHNLRFGEGH